MQMRDSFSKKAKHSKIFLFSIHFTIFFTNTTKVGLFWNEIFDLKIFFNEVAMSPPKRKRGTEIY